MLLILLHDLVLGKQITQVRDEMIGRDRVDRGNLGSTMEYSSRDSWLLIISYPIIYQNLLFRDITVSTVYSQQTPQVQAYLEGVRSLSSSFITPTEFVQKKLSNETVKHSCVIIITSKRHEYSRGASSFWHLTLRSRMGGWGMYVPDGPQKWLRSPQGQNTP